MQLGFENKTVIVTGANAGIGLAIVRAFLEEGARVVAGSRHSDALKKLGFEERLVCAEVDLSLPDGPAQLVKRGVDAFGKVDILVNNVGVAPMREGFLQIQDEDWMMTFQTNLMSMIRTSRAALPHMMEQKSGAIVNIGSESGRQPDINLLDYSAFKAAMLSIAKGMANEFGSLGIRVNTVSPGPARTPLWEKPGGFADGLAEQFHMEKEQAVEHFTRNVRQMPIGRLGQPEEIADVVLFLASERASFVTGAEYQVNGGSLKAH